MTLTEGELTAWGRRIGAVVRAPVFIGLKGPLGAGKSVLARAVARGADVAGPLPSPTFNIVFRYPRGARGEVRGAHGEEAGSSRAASAGSVIHADLFRLESEAELAGIGWEDVLADDDAIVVAEWCRRAGAQVPDDRWEVCLGFASDPGRRTVDIERFGNPAPLPRFPTVVG